MKLSLKKKAILLIVTVGLLIGIAGIAVYNQGIGTIVQLNYNDRVTEIAKATAQVVDPERVRRLRDAVMGIYYATENKVLSDKWGEPEFEEYLSKYAGIDQSEDFLVLREQLRNIQDVLSVECLYITWVDYDNECTIYLVDGAYEDACPPGCIDPIYNENNPILTDHELGFVPLITRTEEYGYLLVAAKPVHTDDGEIVGYATADMSMNDIVAFQHRLVIFTAIAFLAATVLVSVVGIILVGHSIVLPINKLSEAAVNYAENDKAFSQLDIRTGDEIEKLAESMVYMEQEINSYVENLIHTRNALATAREQAEQFDREASIDAMTGCFNKRAYDQALGELESCGDDYAIVMIDLNGMKTINDRYGHDKGDVAIVELVKIINGVFTDLPVYRIGGDEFTVILKNDAFDRRDGLITKFRATVKERYENHALPPWERIAAAIGCAVRKPEQNDTPAIVFKRADDEMYRQKKKMKSDNSAR